MAYPGTGRDAEAILTPWTPSSRASSSPAWSGTAQFVFMSWGSGAVEEQATPEEKRQVADVVAQSIEDGAVGFSTNRFAAHILPDGRSIPGTFAEKEELIEIAKAIAPRKALMQNVLNFDERDFSTELLRDLARTTQSRVLFSFGVSRNPASRRRARE